MADGRGDGGEISGFRRLVMAPGLVIGVGLVLAPLALVAGLSVRINDGSLFGSGCHGRQLRRDRRRSALRPRDPALARHRRPRHAGTVITAYPVAYYLSFHAGRRRGLLLFLVTLPFWTSYLLRVFAWKIVLAYNGVLNSASRFQDLEPALHRFS